MPLPCTRSIADSDADGIPDHEDSCPLHPNSPILGICVGAFGLRGKTCVSDEECGSGGDLLYESVLCFWL